MTSQQWLTDAVDKRVVAIAPQVIDMLNMQVSMKHHHNAYGEYSRAVYPYVENNIMLAIDTPQATASLHIIDPYSYRALLTIPKMIINSGGDPFFLPNSSQFYYDQLSAPKHLRYVPNCGHALDECSWKNMVTIDSNTAGEHERQVYIHHRYGSAAKRMARIFCGINFPRQNL